MGTVLNSIDNMLSQAQAKGIMSRLFIDRVGAATTAANTTSGYVTAQRYPTSITLPSSFGSGVTGIVFPYVRMAQEDTSQSLICCLEYSLGTLTVSGNSFADGVAMPTKTIRGVSITTSAEIPMVVVTTSLTATTPVLTITYTDQDGNTNQTATMTLPTNSLINSAFLITPHLANGDTGIRDITNISISTGSAGVLKIYGLLVLGFSQSTSASTASFINPISIPLSMWPATTSEIITFYKFGTTVTNQILAVISGVADN